MRLSFLFIISVLTLSFAEAQPCKSVKAGMTKSEVLKLAGAPTEVDTVFAEEKENKNLLLRVVWQYGNVMKYGNQRVQFNGAKVDDVIADGKKYDELLLSFQHGDFPESELHNRIIKLNSEACK